MSNDPTVMPLNQSGFSTRRPAADGPLSSEAELQVKIQDFQTSLVKQVIMTRDAEIVLSFTILLNAPHYINILTEPSETLSEPVLLKAMSKLALDLKLTNKPILDLVDKPQLVNKVNVMRSTFKVVQ